MLCVPKGDLRRSRERVPSRWVLDVASVLAGGTWWSEQLLHGTAPWLTHLASFDDAVRTAAVPATAQEHRLRHLLALDAPRPKLHAVAEEVDATLAAGVDTVDARWSTTVTRFDGNLAGLAIPSPLDRGTSATSLETWAKCPHGYFVHHILRVDPIEQPEDALQISPIDQRQPGPPRPRDVHSRPPSPTSGSRRPASRGPRPTTSGSRRSPRVLCDTAEAEGLTGRSLFWQRDRGKILADLDRFLHEDDTHRAATGATPVAAELAFGIGTRRARRASRSPTAGPSRCAARPTASTRPPTAASTSSTTRPAAPRPYKGISEHDPHQGGRRLQLAVYGVAARQHAGAPDAPVRAEYWFTSSKGRFEKLGYDISDEVLDQVSRPWPPSSTASRAACSPPTPSPTTPRRSPTATPATPTASAPPRSSASGSASWTTRSSPATSASSPRPEDQLALAPRP